MRWLRLDSWSPATGHLGDGGAHQLKDLGGVGGGVGGVGVVAQLAKTARAKREQPSILFTHNNIYNYYSKVLIYLLLILTCQKYITIDIITVYMCILTYVKK